MKLIGMLDSPFVRRTAISLKCLGVSFEHQAVSVFSTFEKFQSINPVVKAPSLVLDNGDVLMDSTLIIELAEFMAKDSRSLMPSTIVERQKALRTIGLALAACEKSVQTVYERNLRPVAHQYEPWLVRIKGQLLAACNGLESEISKQVFTENNITTSQAAITAAVAWQFIRSMLSDVVPASQYPALQQLSAVAETLPEFLAFPPDGPGVVANN